MWGTLSRLRRPRARRHRIATTRRGTRRRIGRTTGTSRYLQDGNQIIEELSLSGGTYSTLRHFIWPVPSARVEAGRCIDELVQLKTYANTGSQALTAGVYYANMIPLAN